MPTPAEDFSTSLRTVLLGRVNSDTASEAATLTSMDTFWGQMSAGEKTSHRAYMLAIAAEGSNVKLSLPEFPRKVRVEADMVTDLLTRFA